MNKEPKKIQVKLKDRSYDILIKNNLLTKAGDYCKRLKLGQKILIVTQNKIPKIYIQTVKKNLMENDFKVYTLTLPSGENHKDLNSLLAILRFALKNKFERNDSFCGLGGGVVTDLTGFAASIYYRGLNFISAPTTLLGMVDAAIGGKTGINIKEGKNLLGTFYQPNIVLIDPRCIKTLPKREFLTGIGEVIKYSLLENTAKTCFKRITFFKYLQKNKKEILNLNKEKLLNIIIHSANIKAKIVSTDEKESNLRSILNLGHTFAHGIEQAYNYKKYTHGEAVSIGMCLAAKLAYKKGLIIKNDLNLIIKLIDDFGLPIKLTTKNKTKKIIKSMLVDKKIKNGKLRFILSAHHIGKVIILNDFSNNEIKNLINSSVN